MRAITVRCTTIAGGACTSPTATGRASTLTRSGAVGAVYPTTRWFTFTGFTSTRSIAVTTLPWYIKLQFFRAAIKMRQHSRPLRMKPVFSYL